MNIEATILSNLLHNEEYARKVIVFLKDGYFHDATEKAVFGEIQKFYAKYNDVPSKEALQSSFSPLKGLFQGFFVNLTNIKGTVFFLALIPLFIDLTALKLSTCVIFTATLIGVDLIVMTGYTMLAEISKSLLSDPKKILWQNRVTGLTLIFVGLIMGNT